jgi:hypothetical protein
VEGIHGNSENRRCAHTGKSSANAKHKGDTSRCLCHRGQVDPNLWWVEASFGKEADSAGREAHTRKFAGEVRKHKRTARDPQNVRLVREVKIAGFQSKVIHLK